MSRNVIVIGGVALGPKAASRLKRLDPTANVTMIDENINISFGGCGIPYYVSGEINSLDALRSTTYGTVRTPEYFEHKGVHTLNQTRVTAIDRASKTVTTKNLVTGEEKALPYDRDHRHRQHSQSAPGSKAATSKTWAARTTLRTPTRSARPALPAACRTPWSSAPGSSAWKSPWPSPTCGTSRPAWWNSCRRPCPGVMSASLSDMVRHDLEEHNVDVYTGEKVQRLEGENGVVARVVTDKRTLDADLVIFATGLRAQHSAGPRRRARS